MKGGTKVNKEQWQALKTRDPSWDTAFFCGLKRSKTVCRVSCARRVRQVRDVVIFSTVALALEAGYRPCPFCRPDKPQWQGPKAELVRAAKEYMEIHSTEKFSLEIMASALFINGSYLLRTFKAATGHTLLWYHNYVRCEKARELLTHNELSIAAVGDQTGFLSPAHFSRVFKKTLGVTPSKYRAACLKAMDS